MSDLKFLQYIQLVLFTAFIATYIALLFIIIKEQFNKNKND